MAEWVIRELRSVLARRVERVLGPPDAATRGTDLELPLGRTHARALAIQHPQQAETRLRHLLNTAAAQERYRTATSLAGDLIILYRGRGRFDQALTLVEAKGGKTRAIDLQVLTYKTKERDGSPFPALDDALRRAAMRGVSVRLLVSDWSSKPGSAVSRLRARA